MTGLLDPAGGSVSTANYLLVRELAGRGHRVDFFHPGGGYADPAALLDLPTVTGRPTPDRLSGRVWRAFERSRWGRSRGLVYTAAGLFCTVRGYAAIGRAIAEDHRRRPYHAVLCLGMLAPWREPTLPTISWGQGTPNGEAGFLLRHLRGFVRSAGPVPAGVRLAGYGLRYRLSWAQHRRSRVVVACSRWEAGMWRRLGVAPRRLAVLPYPVALPPAVPPPPPADRFTFLHLGRVVPRKRIDLLLDAVPLARRDDPTIAVRVVGHEAYGSDLRRRLRAGLPDGVSYQERVPFAEVPGLLAGASAVVQPSEHENFGSAVAEGLAHGRPAVVGPTNGTKDYLGRTSVVFREYTPAAVAAAMLAVARTVRADPAGAAADSRAAAERHFDVRRVADGLEQIVRATPQGAGR